MLRRPSPSASGLQAISTFTPPIKVDVFTPSFVHTFEAPSGVSWIRAEVFARPEDTAGGPCNLSTEVATYCDNRIGMLALTSPIYVGGDEDG